MLSIGDLFKKAAFLTCFYIGFCLHGLRTYFNVRIHPEYAPLTNSRRTCADDEYQTNFQSTAFSPFAYP